LTSTIGVPSSASRFFTRTRAPSIAGSSPMQPEGFAGRRARVKTRSRPGRIATRGTTSTSRRADRARSARGHAADCRCEVLATFGRCKPCLGGALSLAWSGVRGSRAETRPAMGCTSTDLGHDGHASLSRPEPATDRRQPRRQRLHERRRLTEAELSANSRSRIAAASRWGPAVHYYPPPAPIQNA